MTINSERAILDCMELVPGRDAACATKGASRIDALFLSRILALLQEESAMHRNFGFDRVKGDLARSRVVV